MTIPRSTVTEFRSASALDGYTTAVSLHAHTNRSSEGMGPVPRYLDRIPLVGPMVRRELREYERRNRESVDFTKVWWHPPVDPRDVLTSERAQITRLGLLPIVSVTDHDTIEGNLEVSRTQSPLTAPISFEWTVPFHAGFLHLGVHNLPPAFARDLFFRLAAFTREPTAASLPELLACLDGDPETLVVLNHPLWDLAGVGAADHAALLRQFLTDHGHRLHAFELNGYRSWRENAAVQTLAEAYAKPLISGGDRHGRAPNALLNLTTATSFGRFAAEVRGECRSALLVMPQYREPLVSRKVASAADVMRPDSSSPDRHGWTARVTFEENGVVQRLSDVWTDGEPLWARAAVRAFLIGASRPCRPMMRAVIWLAGASSSHCTGPAAFIETAPPPSRVHTEPV